MAIAKVCVIGSGVMGSGIAAHVANAGISVLLLDIVKDGPDRSAIARGAIDRMLKADPAPFMSKEAAKLVTPGNLEDDLAQVVDCDWIIEAVVENLEIKQALYEKLEGVRKPGSIVSSNTSTMPLAILTAGRSEDFQRDFLITHFFNPPRYLRLLELVAGPKTRTQAVAEIDAFADFKLGKGVVRCKDTPGFIANRIGTYWIQAAVNEAIDLELSVEAADALASKPMGIPKTGVFGLIDLVGLDLMPLIAKSMAMTLPKGDDFLRISRTPPLFQKMIDEGFTGRKGKGGFYRLNEKRQKLAIDLRTGEYHPAGKVKLEAIERAGKSLKGLATDPSTEGEYVKRVLVQTLGYVASLVPEITDDITAVDEAMRLGYNWTYGPFELIDQLGADWLAEQIGPKAPAILKKASDGFYKTEGGQLLALALDGSYKPVVRKDGVLLLADIKRATKPLLKNASASLWDIGDGVVCFEFTGKMNSLDGDVMKLLGESIALVQMKGLKGLVVYNEGTNFTVGANLGLALFAANIALWPAIEELIAGGQQTYKALKYAPFPVVGAPSGMALGGGCEILLHCDHVQAHAESYIGLVEVGVGIIPGWGGCKEMLARQFAEKRRPQGPMPPIAKVFETISTAQVSKSAALAKELGYLKSSDGITMNRDRLLADAKAKVLEMAQNYTPPVASEFRLPGPTARVAMEMAVDGFRQQGKATPHDETVSKKLAHVLSGGDTDITEILSEDDLLLLERTTFMQLAKTPETLARMEHMLATGKPLRN
jgi:3-hydroxyacyl-CoA dehydrogenase